MIFKVSQQSLKDCSYYCSYSTVHNIQQTKHLLPYLFQKRCDNLVLFIKFLQDFKEKKMISSDGDRYFFYQYQHSFIYVYQYRYWYSKNRYLQIQLYLNLQIPIPLKIQIFNDPDPHL